MAMVYPIAGKTSILYVCECKRVDSESDNNPQFFSSETCILVQQISSAGPILLFQFILN